ncbi:MAG: hypothetical protein H7323_02730, partial [Frankiales bacterium]|nr:hypothetical protein [Frankiales bacterium]
MSADELGFAGGSGGMTADLVDMRSTARVLDSCGTDLSGVAGRAVALTWDGELLLSIPFSPGSAARAEHHLLAAAAALTTRVLRLEALAVLLRTKAELIDMADDGGGLLEQTAQAGAGVLAGVLVVPATLTTVAAGAVWFVAGTSTRQGDAVLAALRGDISLEVLAARVALAPGQQVQDMKARTLHLLRTEGVELLREHPGLTDNVIGALPSFLNTVAGPLSPVVPDTYEGVISALLGLGLDDTPLHLPQLDGRLPLPNPGVFTEPLDTGEALWSSANELQSTAQADAKASAVRVIEVEADGVRRWVVQIPGTQQWELDSVDGSDAVTNLELMADGDAEILRAVIAAMRASGIGPDEQVLLQGHSQGGIVAAALASLPEFRAEFSVGGVFAGGSPIARFEIPADIPVLALEHEQDPVPRSEGRDNPDLPHLTTVHRDLTQILDKLDAQGEDSARRNGV